MKVKVGGRIFDSEKEPILIILTSEEKELIQNMGDQTRFCSFPKSINSQDIVEYMKGDLS